MNSKSSLKVLAVLWALILLTVRTASATEIFIHHPDLNKTTLVTAKKFIIRGDLFFYLLAPSTYPSYNDLSGLIDRWNLGFQNYFPITKTTSVMAQLIAHDDSEKRTKFDWHFHLRQSISPYFAAYVGHDSDHDAEHASFLEGKPYYLNRNYIGFGIPVEGRNFYIEPFTWFFHNTNQRTHLDRSGNILRQEYGLRASGWTDEGISAHLQLCFQTDQAFCLGQAFLGELIIRIRVLSWLELSVGGSFWTDIKASALGNKQGFYKLSWGAAIPF